MLSLVMHSHSYVQAHIQTSVKVTANSFVYLENFTSTLHCGRSVSLKINFLDVLVLICGSNVISTANQI